MVLEDSSRWVVGRSLIWLYRVEEAQRRNYLRGIDFGERRLLARFSVPSNARQDQHLGPFWVNNKFPNS